MTGAIVAAALIALSHTVAPGGADEHVLAGARLFRERRFAEALVEFRVAERLGAPGARGYAAATLVKLAQPEQALALFEAGGAPPAGRDALIDYYHALACYEARLYLCADRILAGIGPRTGPRIAEQAASIRGEIAAALAKAPERDTVDWYLARADGHARAGRTELARAFCVEARALGGRRADRYGVAEAEARLARLAPPRAAGNR